MNTDLYMPGPWEVRPPVAHFHDWEPGAWGPLLDDAYEKQAASGRFAYCRVCEAMAFVGHDESGELVAALWPGPNRGERERIDPRTVAGVETREPGERINEEPVP